MKEEIKNQLIIFKIQVFKKIPSYLFSQIARDFFFSPVNFLHPSLIHFHKKAFGKVFPNFFHKIKLFVMEIRLIIGNKLNKRRHVDEKTT